MTMKVRLCFAGFALAALLGLIYHSEGANAEGDFDVKKAVKSIAAEIKKGNAAGATKMAAAAGKKIEDVADLMAMYRPVAKEGMNLEKLLKKPAFKDAEELGNLAAAMAELTLAKTPPKDAGGGKTKRAWTEFTEHLKEASLELAKAKDQKATSAAATKIENSCNACHAIFKK